MRVSDELNVSFLIVLLTFSHLETQCFLLLLNCCLQKVLTSKRMNSSVFIKSYVSNLTEPVLRYGSWAL